VDRRRNVITITKRGADALERLDAVLAPLTPRERQTLVRLLAELTGRCCGGGDPRRRPRPSDGQGAPQCRSARVVIAREWVCGRIFRCSPRCEVGGSRRRVGRPPHPGSNRSRADAIGRYGASLARSQRDDRRLQRLRGRVGPCGPSASPKRLTDERSSCSPSARAGSQDVAGGSVGVSPERAWLGARFVRRARRTAGRSRCHRGLTW